ncbi:wiskott-Aldrich syndrome protein homolog 1-like [Delphinapterus leucas]|uniref:Wiskott-Aldrich syndrome protein homolog 1-like n=1 Tax=Delphinapterus leucas TaxID=9749 RepID=A0A7F8K8D7_DELLE|nr:wiskott-Aldrich syndrome protein homolog 1-like [Delphinapterus leucas]
MRVTPSGVTARPRRAGTAARPGGEKGAHRARSLGAAWLWSPAAPSPRAAPRARSLLPSFSSPLSLLPPSRSFPPLAPSLLPPSLPPRSELRLKPSAPRRPPPPVRSVESTRPQPSPAVEGRAAGQVAWCLGLSVPGADRCPPGVRPQRLATAPAGAEAAAAAVPMTGSPQGSRNTLHAKP